MNDGASQREKDEQALVRVFTSDQEYCADRMNRLFVNDTEQSKLMTTRLLEGTNDGISQREKDEQALVRVFTSDREYCVDMMNRLFVNNTEQSKLMTSRLLESIYTCQQEDLYTQGLSKTMRVRHYMEQTKWLTESCHLYLGAVKHVVSVEGRGAVLQQWQEWEQALGEEPHGEENDRPMAGRLRTRRCGNAWRR